MSETEVLRAVRSFPAGSAGEPDEVRLQHILEMVNCREVGSELHSALTGFVNYLLQVEIHPRVSPVLPGGNLIALGKKTGGVRPIAIDYTLQYNIRLMHLSQTATTSNMKQMNTKYNSRIT